MHCAPIFLWHNARMAKRGKGKKPKDIGFPIIEEIKYRIKAHKEKQHPDEMIDEDDPLAQEKRATSYLDHEKHGAD